MTPPCHLAARAVLWVLAVGCYDPNAGGPSGGDGGLAPCDDGVPLFPASTAFPASLSDWHTYGPPVVILDVSGEELHVVLAEGSMAYGGIVSMAEVPFRERAFLVEIVEVPAMKEGAQTFLAVGQVASEENLLGVYVENGFVWLDDGATKVPYDPVQHRWLRLREAAGEIHYEARPTGGVWSPVFAPSPSPAWFAEPTFVTTAAGTYEAAMAPGEARTDNVNVPCP